MMPPRTTTHSSAEILLNCLRSVELGETGGKEMAWEEDSDRELLEFMVEDKASRRGQRGAADGTIAYAVAAASTPEL
jgi:uncharacterized Fe-S center protein